MNQQKIPVWFWVVAALMLVWNLVGVGSFIQNMMISEEQLLALPENERVLQETYPLWATIAFAAAVFGGALGCIGLLVKRKWAKPVLIISLIGIVVQMIYNIFISAAMEVYGPGAIAMPIMILLIAIFLLWLANFGIRKNWLT